MTEVDDQLFWDVAEPLLAAGAEESTMMGNKCLRSDGAFFASLDRNTGDLVVKLSAARVDALIDQGLASSFAPNGRRFKEWAAVSAEQALSWPTLMEEARGFVSGT